MTKQDILNTTGLSEEEFYQRYPDQETFCSDYPEMCPDMMEKDDEEDINNYQNLGYDEDEISMAAYGGALYKAQGGVETNKPKLINRNDPIQLKEIVIKPSVETYVQPKPVIDRGNFSQDYEKPITSKDLSAFPWINPQRELKITPSRLAPLALKPSASNAPITNLIDYTKEYLYEMGRRQKRKDANEPLVYKNNKSTANLWRSILANNPNLFPEGATQQVKDSIFDNHFRAYKKLFNENHSPNINIGENILRRTHYNEPTNTIEFAEPNASSILAELAHAQQEEDGRSVWGEYAIDWKNHPFFTGEGQNELYDIPGTIEYDAHELREPLLRKKFRKYLIENNRYKNYINNSESRYDFGEEIKRLKPSDFGIDIKKEMGGSLYEAQDGVQQPAPYTDYNQYQKAMQNYGAEASKAGTYNNFQNDLYNQSGQSRGSSETPRQMGDMFNTLSPEQQDAMAAKYHAEFIPSGTPSANRRNYINSMEMNVPGKGTGYYSFPTNDVVYGNKQLERPKYDFPAMTAPQYKMSATPTANFQGKPINYQPGTANINFGNTPPQPKKFFPEPTQLINNIGASYKDPASLNASNGNLPIPKYSMANTMERVGATNKPYVTPTPNYTSIVDLLKSRKQDSSFSNRKKLAEEIGIKNYTGTASQNMDFIRRINGSKASGAGMTSPSQMQNQEVMNPNNPVQLKNVNFSYKRPIANSQNQPQDQEIINSNNPVQLKNVPFIYKKPQGQPQTQSQQGNKPFYGPGNTLIGSTDDNRQFYPGKYTGAPNNQSNLQDKELLANSEKLKQYLQSKDNYKFELGGVNIHPAMRTNFKQGGSYNTNNNLNKFQFAGPVMDNLSYRKPIYTAPILKKNNLSLEELQALAHQKTGMGSLNGSYVKQHNPIMNDLGNLSPNDLKELQNYMDSRGALEYLYQILPNAGLTYGNSAAELPKNSKLKYKQGGYYGMDGRLHRAKGSGTYVMNGGYYFVEGGGVDDEDVVTSDTPPGAMGNPAAVPQSSLVDNNSYQDYSFDMGTDETGGSPSGQQSMIDPYDPSKYSSSIDPDTGFTNYSKNNQAITNIKKQDPALWDHLKDEGKGARWRTGQTDFQKFGRTAGYIGNVLENGINVASGIGNIINNRSEQRNLNNSAINKGSTASMYTNPQGAGRGTGPGQTGSSYGMMDPSSMGARSFTGMYGKYGMQVPKFQPGGGFSNLFSSAQSVLPVSSPIDLMPNMSFSKLTAPVVDNTGRYQNNRAVNDNQPVDNNQGNSNTPIVNKRGGSDVATRLNNPRNLIYNPVFSKLFGAKKSSTKQTDGDGYFAEFPTIEAGLKAGETQLFGEVDGVFPAPPAAEA